MKSASSSPATRSYKNDFENRIESFDSSVKRQFSANNTAGFYEFERKLTMGYETCPHCGGTNKGTTMHIAKYGAEDRWVADPCPYCLFGGIWKTDPPKQPKAPGGTSNFGSSARKPKTPPLVQNKVKSYNGGKFLFQRHGRGAATHSDGLAYDGGWFFGKWKGKGVLTRRGAWIYEGRFGNGMLHGQGRLTLDDGTIFYGRFKRSEPKGQGKILFGGGTRFEGKWLDGERQIFFGRARFRRGRPHRERRHRCQNGIF